MNNKIFQVLAGLVITGSLAACANTSQEAYYRAVERSAIAQQQAHTAKMQALASMASQGDDASRGAAVMAMALTQAPVVAPQYVQSEGLQWARVLATPVAAVAGFAINAEVAKNASDNAAAVQMANFQSQERIQLGQQDMLVGALNASGTGTTNAINGLVDLGTAGFQALNVAGEQQRDVALAGFDSNQDIATTGFQTTGDIATLGFGTTESVGVSGISGLVDLGTTGLNTVESVSTQGLGALGTVVTDYNGLVGDITTQGIQVDNTELCTVDPATFVVSCN